MIVALDGGKPVFGHVRVGRHGRPFRCWKFRTMVPDADRRLAEILTSDPQAAAEWQQFQKLSNDVRVTRIGRFLRATRLDELPQLVNVLRGEMSLVGPRPVTAEEIWRYGPAAAAVLSLRPGMTGPWQILGRRRVGYDQRVGLDLGYSRNINFLRDAGIFLRTIKVVLDRSGT